MPSRTLTSAWIETGGHVLKNQLIVVALSRVRGLKPLTAPKDGAASRRTLTSAWIETIYPFMLLHIVLSRTLTSAWIETAFWDRPATLQRSHSHECVD